MRTSPAICAFAALATACGGPAAQADPERALREQCAAYAGVGDAEGYCLQHGIAAIGSAERAAAICATAGTYDGRCRRAWVVPRKLAESGVATADLLLACGSDEDCRFTTLDERHVPDVVEQVRWCRAELPTFAADCAGHALQRWLWATPSVEEVARVAAADLGVPDAQGYFVGGAIFCGNRGACPPSGTAAHACTMAIAAFGQRPWLCTERGSMNPGP